jgi:Uma2 family endonuclease
MKVAEALSYTLEDYLKLEETGEVKHEFYYGKLFEMPGAAVLHNNICLKLFLALYNKLNGLGYQVNVENVKVKIENEEIYLYPDILVTREAFKTMKDYIVHQPVLIAEVLSDSTRKYDSTDKFIQYQKISTLRYYLLVEPEKHVVIFYEKDESGEWSGKTFTEMDEVISLPFFQTQLTLGAIYL